MNFIEITPENIEKYGLFCIKNKKHPGFQKKKKWYANEYQNGLRMIILFDDEGSQAGMIEYGFSENCWRPLKAENYIFINCLFVYSKKNYGKGMASSLIGKAIEYARSNNRSGVCTFTSEGSWISGRAVFIKNGFECIEKSERYELQSLKLDDRVSNPEFFDWAKEAGKYYGWNLIYSDQCPLHDKSYTELSDTAKEFGVDLKITKLNKAADAQRAPSGFGTYCIVYNGKLIEDHYISKTRFKNILKKES